MRSKPAFYVLLLILITAGVSLAWIRHVDLNIPLRPGQERPVWLIEARIDFIAAGEPVRVSLDLPEHPPGFRQVSEQAASTGYGFSIIETPGGRRAEWTRREARGAQTLYYKIQMVPEHSDADRRTPVNQKKPQPKTVYWGELQGTAARQLVEQAFER